MESNEKNTLKLIVMHVIVGLLFITIINLFELSILKDEVEDMRCIYFAVILKAVIVVILFVISNRLLIKLFNKKLNYEHMTGLYNRKKLFCDLNSLINTDRNFTLCYIDFDNFKVINDCHGHKAGDILLKEFSNRVTLLRSQKIKGYRIGGDEFVLIIKDSVECDKRIDIIKKITEEEVKIAPGKSIKISFTMGTVENDFISSADELLSKADSRMYKNKRS